MTPESPAWLPAAVTAVHVSICESSLGDCLEHHGPCVKAVEAALPVLRDRLAAEIEARAASVWPNSGPDAAFHTASGMLLAAALVRKGAA